MKEKLNEIKVRIRQEIVERRKIIAILVGLFLVAIIISLTIGKDLLSGRDPVLSSFIILHFAGYLFFLIMPVEALVPYFLSLGHNSFLILTLAIVTALVAELIDYGVGFLASDKIIRSLIGEKTYAKYQGKVHRYGYLTILIFNIFPLSSSVVSLVAGMLKLKGRRFLFYTLLGLTIKYFAIIYVFSLFV